MLAYLSHIFYNKVYMSWEVGIQMEKAFKFRIYPNKTQEELIQKTFECVRFVFNYFLQRRIDAHRENK